MCVTSAVMDYARDRMFPYHPIQQSPIVPTQWVWTNNNPTREEFESLKKEVESLRDLLAQAKKFDEATKQPDCEMADKVDLIKKIAALVGVDIGSVLGG